MLQRRNFLLFLLFFSKKCLVLYFFGVLNMCEKIITS